MQTLPNSTYATQPDRSYTREDWASGYRSQTEEYAYPVEDIEGQIPPELEGTIFRVGPGLLEVAGNPKYPVHHPFDGDGMVNAIAFRDGRAFYRNRYVRTKAYVEEQQAGKPLYRGVFGTQKPGGWLANAFDLNRKNIANTSMMYWGDKLLALWEGGNPHQINPHTLETIGRDTLDGVLEEEQSFTAHPRIDPSCDRIGGQPSLVGFGVKPGLSSTITMYEFDPQGKLFHQSSHSVPGFAFLHDFALTPNYYIFYQNPISFNPLPFLLGMKGAAQCISFEKNKPGQIVLIPRYGEGEMTIVDVDPYFVFHHATAFEQAGQVILDSVCYASFPQVETDTNYKEVDFEAVPEGQLWRFRIDVDQKSVTSECLVSRCCEFPLLHPDRAGHPYRYLFMGAANRPHGNAPLQAYMKVDLETGEQQIWSAAPRGFTGEPNFVPRPGADREDDGWLIGFVYNAERQRTDIVILDSNDLIRGPVATLKLKHHVPYSLHGFFTATSFME